MIDIAQFELEKRVIYISWKEVQMREAVSEVNVPGISDSLNVEAIQQTMNYQLKLSQEYLIEKKVLNFELTDKPLPCNTIASGNIMGRGCRQKSTRK